MFTFIDQFSNSINDLDASDPIPTACVFLDFLDRGIKVLLQDVSQLIKIGRTHILFDHALFRTELLFNYNKTMDTFCITSLNPVSQSLMAVLLEISTQVTSLHYDINGHLNTSTDFLCSNFHQINDNVVTVKKNFLVL